MNERVSKSGRWHAIRRLLAGLAVATALASCGGTATPAEEQVRQWLADMQVAAEEKQRRTMVGMISAAYTDSRGYDREGIEKMLRVYFLRQNNITLLTSINEIQLFGETAADVDVTVAMAGTNDGVLGFSADAYRFELELEKVDEDWLLLSAKWEETGE